MKNYFVEYTGPEKISVAEILQRISKLSEEIIVDALQKGAVTIQRGGKGKILRERNPQASLRPRDKVWLHYDKKVLSLPIFLKPESVAENSRYGVWFKSAGILAQGNQFGDHTSLFRAVEIQRGGETFLVHRLDRETAGLMIIAYDGKAAHALSELFQKNEIEKIYEAVVVGELKQGLKETIVASLDGKKAVTHFEVLAVEKSHSLLRIKIETGRLHQIRRHLDFYGYPVLGDPKYGRNNKNRDGMKLLAQSVKFTDPWSRSEVSYALNWHLEL
jgi:tRNA pseudouridine32 synthase / 23S rRNA pseudouridine746 synthase